MISTENLQREQDYFVGSFTAMASPCSLLVDTEDPLVASELLQIVEREAHRIEKKFSRYLNDNIVHAINHANGRTIEVDEETALLLDYAATCHEMSEGMFDITSGILRKAWKFDGTNHVPSSSVLQTLLPMIGWSRVRWRDRMLQMPAGMEIDFGGIGKEYAVDRASALLMRETDCSFIVNFGGDLYAKGTRAWGVGVDDPTRTGEAAVFRLELSKGGVATSGDARRCLIWNGRRLGHILNPKTGWPVENAPHSVTVVGQTCMEAGTLSTLAYLQGLHARNFLETQGVQFWIL